MSTKVDKLARIERKIMVAHLASMPCYSILGLGMYAFFGVQGEAFLPILNKPDVALGLLIAGALGSFIAAGFTVRLTRERQTVHRR